jgi:VanZ family protein
LLFVGGRQEFAVGLFPAPWDKLAHAAYFGSLTALLWMAGGARAVLGPVLIAAGVGLADELHQATLPGREASLADFTVDVAAAAVAGTLLRSGMRSPARRSREPPIASPRQR